MNNPTTSIKQLESKIAHLSTDITSIKRGIKRQPTDEIHTLTYKDGSEYKFRVYKNPAGLVKPHIAYTDLAMGKRYIDETEPLD